MIRSRREYNPSSYKLGGFTRRCPPPCSKRVCLPRWSAVEVLFRTPKCDRASAAVVFRLVQKEMGVNFPQHESYTRGNGWFKMEHLLTLTPNEISGDGLTLITIGKRLHGFALNPV